MVVPCLTAANPQCTAGDIISPCVGSNKVKKQQSGSGGNLASFVEDQMKA